MSDSGSGFSWNLTPDPTPPAADQPPRRRGRRAEVAPQEPVTPSAEAPPTPEPTPRTLSELTGLPAIVPWSGPTAPPAETTAPDAEAPDAATPAAPAAPLLPAATAGDDALADLFGEEPFEPAAPRPAREAPEANATQAFTFTPAAPEAPQPPTEDAATQAFVFPITPAATEVAPPKAADPDRTQAFAFTPPVPEPTGPTSTDAASPSPVSAPETPPEPVSLDTGFAALGIFTSPAPIVETKPATASVPSPDQKPASAQPTAIAFPAAAAPVAAPPPAVAVAADGRRSIVPARVTSTPDSGEIDSLFAADNFRDVEANPPTTQMSERRAALDRAPAEPMTTTQKVLFWVAGGLLLALAIVAVFLVVTRLGDATTREPTSPAAPVDEEPVEPELPESGPLPAGEYGWDLLRGGECISPFESAWQETFTVVDCATPHQAQLLSRGELADAADAAFPALEELQARITMMCTEPAVLNQELTTGGADVRIVAAFPVDEAAWSQGQRNYDCFALRVDGTDFTQSVLAG